MVSTSVNDYGICISSVDVTSPPCPVFVQNNPNLNRSLNCSTSMLLSDFKGLNVPKPHGLNLQSLRSIMSRLPTKYANIALHNLNTIHNAANITGATRILSCSQSSLYAQNESVFVTTGTNSQMFQPFQIGCLPSSVQEFCPLFTTGGIFYKFWTNHPLGAQPQGYNSSIHNKIRLYFAPGLSESDINVNVIQKRACNMDINGSTCFKIDGSTLHEIGKDSGYYADNPSFPFIVWPLNVIAEWSINNNLTHSAWQTWLVIDYDASIEELAGCLPIGEILP